MNPLESRKKLLIAESELNREQLVQDWQTLADEVHALTSRASTITSFASAAATLVVGGAFLRHKKPAFAAGKASWWQTVLKGAGLASSLWSVFRPQGRGQKDML